MSQPLQPIGKDKGDFAEGKVEWTILNGVGRCKNNLPPSVNLTGSLHLKPYSLAALAALGAQAERKLPLVLPDDATARAHLISMGLPTWYQCADGGQFVASSNSVPIVQLKNQPGSFADDATRLWEEECGGLPGGLRREFATHIDEMIFNSLGHSDSDVGCFVAGQAFPKRGFVEVVVLDLGISIPIHLRRNKGIVTPGDDLEAIAFATIDGVTGTPRGKLNNLGQPNSGAGLTSVRKFCEAGGGCVTVVSGGGMVTYDESRNPRKRVVRGMFGGTIINLRLFTGSEQVLPQTVPSEILW